MLAPNTETQYYVNEYERVKSLLPGHGLWFDEYRASALKKFTTLGFPNRKTEDWRYSSVFQLVNHAFKAIEPQKFEKKFSYPSFCKAEDTKLVFVNGVFQPSLSVSKEIEFSSLKEILENNPEKIKSFLQDETPDTLHVFSALNTLFLTDGLYIHIKPQQVISNPIYIIHHVTASDQMIYTRNFILVDENAQATFVEYFSGDAEQAYFANAITDIVLAKHAIATHYKIQEESEKAFHISLLKVAQARESHFISHAFAAKGGFIRSDIRVNLNEEYTETDLNGFYYTKGHQHIDHHTEIRHLKPHGQSREFYKGIADDQSKAIFNGKVYVAEDAQKINAEQRNANLLLSNQAEVDTKPQLEIFADDVKCSHGASVGQLSQDALFYCRSRGISEIEAKKLLLNAFAHEILDKITLTPIKEYLEHRVI